MDRDRELEKERIDSRGKENLLYNILDVRDVKITDSFNFLKEYINEYCETIKISSFLGDNFQV